MIEFRTLAIPSKVADLVRSTLRSPGYGHPVTESIATGYGPCRHCLRFFDTGVDRRLLFTYDPFYEVEPLPLPGPVFIHAEACERYKEDAGFPAYLGSHPLTLNGYGRGRRLTAQEYVTDGNVDGLIQELLTRSDVDYIHVR
ncbi:MAG: DUF1203 domain-containing protein, partial [Blastocatellia bacterium]